MNHTYRIVWNKSKRIWQVASEFTKGGKGKTRSNRSLSAIAAGTLFWISVPLHAANLPTNGQVVAGQGTIQTSGNSLTINQNSQNMAINWQDFSIAEGHTVNFVQPNAQAAALNRVTGNQVSEIRGALNANGRVFLVNPNGIMFSDTARVDVGSLVASTLNISTEDFMAGNYHFAGSSANAVINQGNIQTAQGGMVAMIAARIINTGNITTSGGSTLMGAGSRVTLDMGGPVKIEVEESQLETYIEQGGAIRADGGLVYLTAKAANELTASVINHTGITQAQTLTAGADGRIMLMGDMDSGVVQVAGTLDASAPSTGNGGFIETSAAKVQVNDVKVTTLAEYGKTGTWLIDPTDFTIAVTNGDITGAALSANLATTDVTIESVNGDNANGHGDIFVNDQVSWSSGNTLTLNAQRNIEINAKIDASQGSGGKLALKYGQTTADGILDGKAADYYVKAPVNLQAGQTLSTQLGSQNQETNWTVVTDAAAMQSMGLESTQHYALGADLTLTGTNNWTPIGDSWHAFKGKFDGLGHTVSNLHVNKNNSNHVGLFAKTDGATITNIGLHNTNFTGSNSIGGLVGDSNNSTINNSYSTGKISGQSSVGGLVGVSFSSHITRSYSATDVVGIYNVGGLVGFQSQGTISNSYATGNVESPKNSGGLVGNSVKGQISNSYAIGDVQGGANVGGLAGSFSSGTITHALATGKVSGNENVGVLVGNRNSGTITGSFFATDSSAQMKGVGAGITKGATGKTSAEMKQAATYSDAGWDIATQGGSSAVWRIYEGQSGPLLRNFLTDITLTVSADTALTQEYDATTTINAENANALESSWSLNGTAYDGTQDNKLLGNGFTLDSKNVGSRDLVSGYSSVQQGYDIKLNTENAKVDVTAKAITVSGITAQDKTYDGNSTASVNTDNAQVSGLIIGDDLTLKVNSTFADKNVGKDKTVTLANASTGADADNYAFSFNTTSANINQKAITVSGITADNKTYDGSSTASVNATDASGWINGDDIIISASGTFNDKHAGENKIVSLTSSYTGTDLGNYIITDQTSTTANIAKKAITVSDITAQDKTYDGNSTASVNTDNAQVSGLIIGDDLTLKVNSTFADKNVGKDKTVTLANASTGADADNYAFSFNTTTANITPRSVTVTADNADKSQGAADPALTYQTGCGQLTSDCGLVNGERLSGTIIREAGEQAGNYAIQQGTVNDAVNPNYVINFEPGKFVINKLTSNSEKNVVTGSEKNVAIGALQQLTEGQSGGNQQTGIGQRGMEFVVSSRITSSPNGQGPEVSGGLELVEYDEANTAEQSANRKNSGLLPLFVVNDGIRMDNTLNAYGN
ncbi:YDG domain-containing protein [Oceanisphaera sp. W20_SRM_FM3]|uniref:YDG domain-containing protein n=1 Tax=Oceanisphaera sp. W20_SRM_FM3 TaxID=3240267 RepID=UPI003F9DCC84